MTLLELKNFLEKIPNHMNDYEVVNGEVGYLDIKDEDSLVYRIDKPIITLYVDESSKEICFFHQTQEDVNKALNNN
jgi:TATA-box binding protein (TBP) (component of TFIID and TFIIIB)